MPGNTQSARLIREVWNANQDAKRDKAVNLMSKIFRNVLKDPSEAKYRKIKRTAIDKRLGSIVGALALLKHVGFEPIVEHYVLASNKDLSALVDAVEVRAPEFDSREAKRAAAAQKLKEVVEYRRALSPFPLFLFLFLCLGDKQQKGQSGDAKEGGTPQEGANL
eukprot:1328255-Amorphochlora_amoeboformis.AAC.1